MLMNVQKEEKVQVQVQMSSLHGIPYRDCGCNLLYPS